MKLRWTAVLFLAVALSGCVTPKTILKDNASPVDASAFPANGKSIVILGSGYVGLKPAYNLYEVRKPGIIGVPAVWARIERSEDVKARGAERVEYFLSNSGEPRAYMIEPGRYMLDIYAAIDDFGAYQGLGTGLSPADKDGSIAPVIEVTAGEVIYAGRQLFSFHADKVDYEISDRSGELPFYLENMPELKGLEGRIETRLMKFETVPEEMVRKGEKDYEGRILAGGLFIAVWTQSAKPLPVK